jgi:hypothetical protein
MAKAASEPRFRASQPRGSPEMELISPRRAPKPNRFAAMAAANAFAMRAFLFRQGKT